jgi:DNA-binding response OmpR family regulator
MKKGETLMEKGVLLIDDDEKLLKLLTEYLEGYGYHILTLVDGLAVLETIRVESPDIIILDIMLPKKDGFEVLKEIRLEYSIPVIMLTAKGEDADRIVGLELGADDYPPTQKAPHACVGMNALRVIRRSSF